MRLSVPRGGDRPPVVNPPLPYTALSLHQPWLEAVVSGGKRIENRVDWSGSSFRGELLLHATKTLLAREYRTVVAFCRAQGIPWTPPSGELLTLGAIVARCRVVDVIMPGGLVHAGPGHRPSEAGTARHPLALDPWYMGEFALVLGDVEALPTPIPYLGAQGFFRVPREVLR